MGQSVPHVRHQRLIEQFLGLMKLMGFARLNNRQRFGMPYLGRLIVPSPAGSNRFVLNRGAFGPQRCGAVR